MYYGFDASSYLEHYGVKGMKWGIRRTPEQLGYRSSSLKSYIARKKNEKVDKSFDRWKEESNKRDSAISFGKQYNEAKMTYEKNPTKQNKKTLKSSKMDYKKALSKNTAYRKGVVRYEVERDYSRKALSQAKKLKKQLEKDPTNKDLKKSYDKFMNEHDVYRASSRKARSVGEARSRRIASFKRGLNMSIKAAAVSGVTALGVKVASNYFPQIRNLNMSSSDVLYYTKKIQNIMRYVY